MLLKWYKSEPIKDWEVISQKMKENGFDKSAKQCRER